MLLNYCVWYRIILAFTGLTYGTLKNVYISFVWYEILSYVHVFVSLVVFGLWCCLINQCFILYDSEVQKLLSLISVTCRTNERDFY
jgi:hypothetical protein